MGQKNIENFLITRIFRIKNFMLKNLVKTAIFVV